VNKDQAIDGAIGFNGFSVHADYLWHDWDLFPRPAAGKFAGYIGVGGEIAIDNTSQIGARLVMGFEYDMVKHPIEMFVEIAPVLNIWEKADTELDDGFGVRYYFK